MNLGGALNAKEWDNNEDKGIGTVRKERICYW